MCHFPSRVGCARQRRRGWWAQPTLQACLLFIATLAACADDGQKLDQFLNRLGLADLRLTHMERLLERETAGDKRLAMARQLADAYAEELVAAADESERFAALKARIEKLLAALPQASTPAVEVVLLQADYQRAESLMTHWLEEPSDKASLDEASKILARIQPILSTRQTELAAAADKAADAIDAIKNEPQRLAAEGQLKRQRAVAARADYFAGWAAYYLGVTRQDPKAAAREFAAAKQHFSRVLDVTDEKNYEPIDADSLGLDSSWRSRCVIGLGLTELGLRHIAAAANVFGWLHHSSVPPAIRDQADYWHVQGLLNAGLVAEASRFVTKEVAAFTGMPSAGKSSLCIAAIRAGAATASAQSDDRRQLLEQGIRGLARMRQFETLDKLIEKYKLDDGPLASSFHLAWLRGRRQYLAGEKAKQADAFAPRPKPFPPRSISRKRGAIWRRRGRPGITWRGAGSAWTNSTRRRDLFHEAGTALRSAAPEVALQAAWMHATCLVQLASKDKRQVTPAITALQSFKQEFPSSDEAQRAGVLITRLRQTYSDPQDAIRELSAVKPGDAAYASSQYEVCQLQYQLWTKAKSDAAKAEPLAKDVLKAADHFLNLENSGGDEQRRLKAALLAVDVLQSSRAPDYSRITSLLASVAKAADHLEPNSATAIEYQYRRLQVAQHRGDAGATQAAADQIARHGNGTPFELPALVIVARAADRAVTNASVTDRGAKIAEAARIYGRLAELLGDSAAVLKANKNAVAALSKLAQYDEEQGNWPRAADRLERLVEALPRDRRLLKRAGLACYEAGRYGPALVHWRARCSAAWKTAATIGLRPSITRSPACGGPTPETQRKCSAQFRILFPTVKSAAWREKFAELEKQIHD